MNRLHLMIKDGRITRIPDCGTNHENILPGSSHRMAKCGDSALDAGAHNGDVLLAATRPRLGDGR